MTALDGRAHGGFIEKIMADFPAIQFEHGQQGAVALGQFTLPTDLDLVPAKRHAKVSQAGFHLVAEMAAGPCVEGELSQAAGERRANHRPA